MMRKLVLPTLAALCFIISSVASSHCLVPDEHIWKFECENTKEKVTVKVRIFSDEDPRACPSIIDFKVIGEHPVNNIDDSFIGGSPISRRDANGKLEVLVGWSSNHFSVVVNDGTGKGYIEFGGGPSWDLECTY